MLSWRLLTRLSESISTFPLSQKCGHKAVLPEGSLITAYKCFFFAGVKLVLIWGREIRKIGRHVQWGFLWFHTRQIYLLLFYNPFSFVFILTHILKTVCNFQRHFCHTGGGSELPVYVSNEGPHCTCMCVLFWKFPSNTGISNVNNASTRSMVYNGTGYKGNFGPSTEALFTEWRHCYFITVTS